MRLDGASWVARRRGRADGARPRLRSGAFAPDFPVVILVRLRLPSDSLGRIKVARHPPDPADGLALSWFDALPGFCLLTRFAWPADCGRAGGAQSAYALLVRCGGGRLRAGGEGVAKGLAVTE